MPLPTTETIAEGPTFDALPAFEAGQRMLDGQRDALEAVRGALAGITQAAEAMAASIRNQNTIIYAAAGSSGLMALADASELHGTFGIPTGSVQIHMAGGVPTTGNMPGDIEDDTDAAKSVAQNIKTGDAVIVLSASGTTPYALQVATSVKEKGATVIGIANNPATPLLDMADIAVCLATPSEIIAGSTRLGAGTAQKAALNLMSSLMGVALGHVYQGLMVNVVADNAKLKARAAGIVARIADVSQAQAADALQRAGADTKTAVLIASGASPEAARDLLTTHQGHLGPCLQTVSTNQDVKIQ